MISMRKKLWLVLCAAVSVAVLAGCNDTLRQFIVPVPKPTGDPGASAHAIVLSTNPAAGGNGSTFHIDVSGDTAVGVVRTGPHPVFLGKGPSQVFVINGNNTLTSYLALLPLSPPVNTVTMPPSSTGPVAGGTASSGNFYTANNSSNDVDVLSSFVNAITASVPTGSAPVAIAGNAINHKIYVVNQASNNVTVISTTDNTVIKTIPVGLQPIWGVMANNGIQVFIVNQGDGTVSVIDTSLDIVIPCTPGPQCDSGTGMIRLDPSGTTSSTLLPNFAFYDASKQRLYVSNTGLNSIGQNTISVIKADGISLGVTPQILPGFLGNIKRDSLGGPGTFTADLSITKNTKITERLNMQLRTECFNCFNHFNVGGTLTGTLGGINQPGGLTGFTGGSQSPVVTPRQIQFALKFDF